MLRHATTMRPAATQRISPPGDYECRSTSSRSALRLIIIFVSLTWTTYVFWMQRYVELDHRKTTFTTSLHDFLVDIPFINTKMAVEAVFYHIVIPETEEESMYTSRIVAQQLEQMTSASVKYVYYTTQGPMHHDLVANKAFLQGICRRLDLVCHYKGHVQSETESLAHLHDYCTNAMHDEYYDGTNRLVSYIHSSPRVVHAEIPVNRRLRNILTESALSDECTTALRQENQCNVCGLMFTSEHTLHYPGNMWSASCQYVEKLIKPVEYPDALQGVIGQVLVQRLSRDTMTNLYPDSKLGLGESIMEHWIGSHPELMPCDVGSSDDFNNYLKHEYSTDDLSWRQAPRRPIRDMISSVAKDTVLARTEYRLREYYLLPGTIMKWRGMYGSIPELDSYVWDAFPDGTFWKLATEKYGPHALENVVHVPSMALSGQDLPPHLPDAAPLFAPSTGDASMDLKANLTVFYDIYIPTTTDDKLVTKDLDVIQQQVRAMTEATNGLPVAVYYHTMGNDALMDLDLCEDDTRLECRLLKHFDRRYQGETIHQLTKFCSANPQARVSYIHNQIPKELRQGRAVNDMRMMRALTMGAVSQECFHPEESTCNLCSLIFELLPNPGALGNMWTASCDYVNNLLPLDVFQEQTQQYIGQLLAMKLSGQILLHDFHEKTEQLGLGSYSLPQWIGSSPVLAPCDVTTKALSYWSGAEHSPIELKFSKAPHKHNGVLDIDRTLVEETVDDSLRIREYQYLAGRLLKWHMLYGKAPERQSFAWRVFPDAQLWRNATSLYGNKTVDIITKQHMHTLES